MLHENAPETDRGRRAVGALYLIDTEKEIQLSQFYPVGTGECSARAPCARAPVANEDLKRPKLGGLTRAGVGTERCPLQSGSSPSADTVVEGRSGAALRLFPGSLPGPARARR